MLFLYALQQMKVTTTVKSKKVSTPNCTVSSRTTKHTFNHHNHDRVNVRYRPKKVKRLRRVVSKDAPFGTPWNTGRRPNVSRTFLHNRTPPANGNSPQSCVPHCGNFYTGSPTGVFTPAMESPLQICNLNDLSHYNSTYVSIKLTFMNILNISLLYESN